MAQSRREALIQRLSELQEYLDPRVDLTHLSDGQLAQLVKKAEAAALEAKADEAIHGALRNADPLPWSSPSQLYFSFLLTILKRPSAQRKILFAVIALTVLSLLWAAVA